MSSRAVSHLPSGRRRSGRAAACLGIGLVAAVLPAIAQAWTFDVLHTFSGKEGANPVGAPAVDANGNLYGTTFDGTRRHYGSLWKLSTAGRFESLHWFNGPGEGDGSYPQGSLLADKAGSIYGTTSNGGTADAGTIFKYTPAGGYQLLVSIPGGVAGGTVYAGIAREESSGTMYTVTFFGGDPVCDCGTIVKIDSKTLELKVIHTFVGSDGANPQGTPINSGGNLYGATTSGLAAFTGSPYSMKLNGTNFATQAPTEGSLFASGLAKDAQGSFWGVAYQGSVSAPWGGIYKVDAAGTYSWQYSFQAATDGANAIGTPVIGADGKIYGTTTTQGPGFCGTVYQFDPASRTLTTLHAFERTHDGCSPSAGLAQDAAGVLYGVASAGGKSGLGTVFRLTP